MARRCRLITETIYRRRDGSDDAQQQHRHRPAEHRHRPAEHHSDAAT